MKAGFARSANAGRRLVARLAACRRGVAAVEFGMIVPLMFLLFVGAVEISQAISVNRRVTQVASSTADLVARQSTIDYTTMNGYMQIISQIVAPYDTTALKLSVLSVYSTTAAPTNTLICWAFQWNGGAAAYSAGGTYAVPTGVLSTAGGTSVIVAEVNYVYTPLVFHYFITSTLPMYEKFYLKPRLSANVQYTDASSTVHTCL